MAEGAVAAGTVSRNGDQSQPLTVWLTNGDATELRLTNQVVIPSGQAAASFGVEAGLDAAVDGAQSVAVVAAAAGYENVTNRLTVLDVDVPHLALSVSPDALVEGFSATATVRRDYGTNEALGVQVSSSSPLQFVVPATVTIPAGQWSNTFAVSVRDDTQVKGPWTCLLSAAAGGFVGASASVMVWDDNAPGVTLTVTPGTVSEAAGPQAAVGTLTRSLVTGRGLVVDLESSNPAKLLVPAWVRIPGDLASVEFPIAAVDDAEADGTKTISIVPYVTATGTGTRLHADAPATVQVTDDNGPALKLVLAQTLVAEGLAPATTATVSRNTGTSGALTVTLASSDASEATVPPAVTIADGQSAAVCPIATVNDGVSDGNQSVTLTASAPASPAAPPRWWCRT